MGELLEEVAGALREAGVDGSNESYRLAEAVIARLGLRAESKLVVRDEGARPHSRWVSPWRAAGMDEFVAGGSL